MFLCISCRNIIWINYYSMKAKQMGLHKIYLNSVTYLKLFYIRIWYTDLLLFDNAIVSRPIIWLIIITLQSQP